MQINNTLTVLVIALAGAFALRPSVSVGGIPITPVTITNTPVPVTATLSGPTTVSATVTNTASNPVPVTNSDRPTAFNQTFSTSGFNSTVVQVPTSCRLVVQVVSFNTADSAATAHLPTIAVATSQGTTLASYIIPAQQVANTSNPIFTVGTLALQLIVDSPNDLYVTDALAPANTNSQGFWSISGYLLRLTPSATC